MIIDRILDRKDSLEYDAKSFYLECLSYGKAGENITRAMDFGTEDDVKAALCKYIQDNEYNYLLVDYINSLEWLRKCPLELETEAAKKFDDACKVREEAAEKMKAPEGKDSIFAFECGVLLSLEHDEFDYYVNNNPKLPYGFYDENQGMFLKHELGNELYGLRDYVKNGVDNTYAVISFQGFVDIGSDAHENLLKGKFDTGDVSYTFFKNLDEIVWSACKIDGKLIEGFLEKEIAAAKSRIVEVPKDKIFVALHDSDYCVLRDSYTFSAPPIFTGKHIREFYAFDTPEEFVAKWRELDEGAWYWVFDKGEIVCSGALDPNDIELFEDYWGRGFDEPEKEGSLDEKIESAKAQKAAVVLDLVERER